MSATDPPPEGLADRVDRACDAFEAAWRAGQAPRIEAFLAGTAVADRPAFLRELIATELELRRAGGEPPRAEEYVGRFPEHATLVQDLFLAPTAGTVADGPGDQGQRQLTF